MQRRRPVSNEGILSIIEIALLVLHVENGPLRNLNRDLDAPWMQVPKIDQSLDGLRGALDVEGARFVVVIPWRSIWPKKRIHKEPVSFFQFRLKRPVSSTLDIVM